MKILIVDDEVALLDALQRAITREGHEVDIATSADAGCDLVATHSYDLLVLDWMLPGYSGLELCTRLRAQGQEMPVLFLTAKDTLDDRVMGLDAGADDYIVKPFELRELLARVRALLRRSQSFPHAAPTERCKAAPEPEIELERDSRLAYRNRRTIELSEKETHLLDYFLTHRDRVLSHQEIYTALWGRDRPPNSNVVAALIRLLRRKITCNNETPLVHTVYGKGYRFGSARTARSS